MNTIRKIGAAVLAVTLTAVGALRAETITVKEVSNHYPWDGKVDCVYTLGGTWGGCRGGAYDYNVVFTQSVEKAGARQTNVVTADHSRANGTYDGTFTNTFDCAALFGAGLYTNGVISAALVKEAVLHDEGDYTGEIVPTAVNGTTVHVNDLQDHEWMRDVHPRNIKITYNGVDLHGSLGSNVGTPDQNQFVYLKTIVPTSDEYTYQTISSPFSKTPVVDNGDENVIYYVFAGWRIVKGADYILRANGVLAMNNDVLDVDERISFKNLGSDDSNAQLFEVELETTWTPR